MDKPMTTADLFDKICEILKKEEVYPDILDYALPEYNPVPIMTYEFCIKNNLDYGGSEGIYLDLWIEMYTDGELQKFPLGTFKTLREDHDAMRIMGTLLADFLAEERTYVNANLDDFTWKGANIRIYDDSGNELKWVYTCKNMESAMKKKDELLQKYQRVVIRDNATRKEASYTA